MPAGHRRGGARARAGRRRGAVHRPLLLTVVFCTADDLLPERHKNARRSVTAAIAARTAGWFYGFRLHLAASPDGTPRAAILAGANHEERDVALRLLRGLVADGELVIADKGCAGRDFERAVQGDGRRAAQTAAQERAPARAAAIQIRQRIKSIFWTFKDLLTLERPTGAKSVGWRASQGSDGGSD